MGKKPRAWIEASEFASAAVWAAIICGESATLLGTLASFLALPVVGVTLFVVAPGLGARPEVVVWRRCSTTVGTSTGTAVGAGGCGVVAGLGGTGTGGVEGVVGVVLPAHAGGKATTTDSE